MTKRVRIENADSQINFKVMVEVWDKGKNGDPDTMAKEISLLFPTAMTDDNLFITSTRYLIVKEG